MLNELDKMMRCPETAATLLPRLSGFDSAIRSTILNVLRCGATPRTDPYLYSCLVAIRGHHLVNLQVKARRFIDKGAQLMGCLDETGLLPEGCVFVQISSSNSKSQILSGPVLVTKHPVMNPGDVRMLVNFADTVMSFFLVGTVIDQRQTKWLVLILTEMSLGGTIDCFSITGMVVEPTWKGIGF